MNVSEIAFGEFLPDAPDYQNPGCTRAENVYPIPGGYAPFRGPGAALGTGTGTCRGAALFTRSTGDAITVGGSSDRLWVDVSGTVTETLVANALGADDQWFFHRFGARILACTIANDLYELTDLDSDTAWSVLADPPAKATVIGEVSQRLMVGNTGSNPYQIQWAALNEPITWTASATNLNGTAELPQHLGAITGIAGRRFPLIFQEHGISRIDGVTGASVFRREVIEEARGCIAPASIAAVGFKVFFLAHDGFFVTDGNSVAPLGSSRVNRYFLDHASHVDMAKTHAAIDWANESVVWSYTGNAGGTAQIIYSWSQNRWSTASLAIGRLVEGRVAGLTLDQLDATYPDLDAMEVSLDSPIFRAGRRKLSAYMADGSDSTLYALDGDTLQADFETADFQPVPGRRVYANAIWPVIENADANTTAALIARETKGGVERSTPASVMNAAGFCPVRADGRWLKARVTIPAAASWQKAQGLQVAFRPSGWR